MTFSDPEMKELGRGTAYNTHNITSLIRTPQACIRYLADGRSLYGGRAYTRVPPHTHTDRDTHTHTHTHTRTHRHTQTHTETDRHTHTHASIKCLCSLGDGDRVWKQSFCKAIER